MNAKRKASALKPLTSLARCALGLLILSFAADMITSLSGPLLMLVLAVIAGSALVCAGEVHRLITVLLGRPSPAALYSNLLLAVGALGAAAFIIELGLQTVGELTPAGSGREVSIPEKWKRQPTSVPGAVNAYYWHGVLHVHDDRGVRRSKPLPPKKADCCRIAVFGDSLTYGYGVEEGSTYPALLEEALSDRHCVEVLNLGISGYQSENVLDLIRNELPTLEADLVVYGVCHNDFLDSGTGQEGNRSRRTWPFPLPEWFKREMIYRTVTGEVVERGYDALLMRLGVRLDFYDDILAGFEGYRTRFGRDVREMSRLALSQGIPPPLGMVLDQFPREGGRGQRIALIAEELMDEAGMEVVPTSKYYLRHDGVEMGVSRWESHPNATAHSLFAGNLLETLEGHSSLVRCRKEE